MADKSEIKEELYTAEKFIEAYKKLCDEYGFAINAIPTFKQSLDNGDWRIVIQVAVEKK